MDRDNRRVRRLALAAGTAALAAAVLFALLWRSGIFFRLDTFESPRGNSRAAAYSREAEYARLFSPNGLAFGSREGLTLAFWTDGGSVSLAGYGESEYISGGWSPGGDKFAFCFRQAGETRLELYWMEKNSVGSLNAYFSMADISAAPELSEVIYAAQSPEYRFVRWTDGDCMLIQYSSAKGSGSFVYNCREGSISPAEEI